ncbi:unnamed protein product [Brachionus calyciflorus]|uniref:Reverse transcriptase domain-containing protein n=1 Tax=Brachionus calyciflorus TaxID=104777 RepID=A0A814FAK3_9BILA|nr:unnamed protein product [Brachionus calyciflorus]
MINKSKNDKPKYNKLKNLIKDEIAAYKNLNWQKFIDSLGSKVTSSRPFWQKIKKAGSKKSESKTIPTLNYEKKIFDTELNTANLFGTILEDTFKNGNEPAFDNTFKQEIDDFITHQNFEFNLNEPFSMIELENELKLNKNATQGHDNIHNLMLINSSEEFKKIILKLFNASLASSTVPTLWKLASVTMIPKKTEKSKNPKDYRPISITSCLGKLCEKLIYQRLIKYLKDKNIILNKQSGFRQKRQTKDNLIHSTQKIIENFNRKKNICAFFFDIASAFDKIWHNGLIYIMIKNGIPVYLISWCKNFLDDHYSSFILPTLTKTRIRKFQAIIKKYFDSAIINIDKT